MIMIPQQALLLLIGQVLIPIPIPQYSSQNLPRFMDSLIHGIDKYLVFLRYDTRPSDRKGINLIAIYVTQA